MFPQTLDEILASIPHHQALRSACRAAHVSAWLVGGCVRDLLAGRTPGDIDLASDNPEPLAHRLADLLDAHVVPLDPLHGIWRVAYASNRYFDICRFRAADIRGDLHGRDFTINAMAVRLPEEGHPAELYDPLHGVDDLRAGLLRQASPTALRDDPARILRAFRFLAEFPLLIDAATWTALADATAQLQQVAPERLLAEWWKLCAGRFAIEAIARMDEAGVLMTIFPELRPCKGVTQNAYHHLDVWDHMRLTAENTARMQASPSELFADLQSRFTPLLDDPHRRARLLFLALLHDLGKPSTRTVEDGQVHFYGHDVAGAALADSLCRRLRMSREDTRSIVNTIRHHLRPLHLLQAYRRDALSDRAKLHFIDDAGDCLLEILALGLADKTASRGPASEPDMLAQLHAVYHDLFAFYHTRYLPALASPFLTGADLQHLLHLPPGPHYRHILHRARDMQIYGKLTSREQALCWAAKSTPE